MTERNCLDCGKRFKILGNVKKQYSPVFHDGKMPSKRSNVTNHTFVLNVGRILFLKAL